MRVFRRSHTSRALRNVLRRLFDDEEVTLRQSTRIRHVRWARSHEIVEQLPPSSEYFKANMTRDWNNVVEGKD